MSHSVQIVASLNVSHIGGLLTENDVRGIVIPWYRGAMRPIYLLPEWPCCKFGQCGLPLVVRIHNTGILQLDLCCPRSFRGTLPVNDIEQTLKALGYL